MNRSMARAQAMSLVYEWEMGGDGGDDTRFNLLEVKQGDPELGFMNELYEGVVAHQEELDPLISEYCRGWTLERLSRVDLAILRLGVYEMMYGDNPMPVIINEALELANTYSNEKAGPFINGVLGSISRSGKINRQE